MNESWYWIKQRPHFIAEYLSGYYNVEVFCEKRYRNRVDNLIPPNIKINEIYKFPFAHNKIIKYTNKILHRKILFNKYFKNINEKFDIVWFNSPKHFDYIKRFIDDKKIVIYDCMDDLLEFKGSGKSSRIFNDHFSQEKELFQRSNITFCSSETLKEKLTKRYGKKENVFVINNAVFIEESETENEKITNDIKDIFKKNKKTLCYIGTISDWFDFDILIKCLDEFRETGIVIVGPSEVDIPTHERLYKIPPVSHTNVIKIMKMSDVLIMPFKITELVKSVNPVKLYEYIYSCVPSIVVSYPEAEKFIEFVYLYNSYYEFKEYIKQLLQGNLKLKSSREKHKNFARQNTWEQRTSEMFARIEKLL
jgi:teichuronic acid biosynthesis glycosyltransferase TuaH